MAFSAGGGGGRGEPARWLEIAGKLLAARDLVGCKRLTERALEADARLPGGNELLAVADVLLASQRQLPSGRPDPVAVLLLQPNPDPAAVKRSFRRLSQLISSPHNPHPAAATALSFVQEAFADLSVASDSATADNPPDPAPASGEASAAAAAAADAFWTACPYCCHVYQYERELVGRALRCQSAGCRRAFVATEIPTAPPIVPGTDMYYCAWGFFPMGFPKAADLSTNWKPFCPMLPGSSPLPQPSSAGTGSVGVQNVENNGVHVSTNATPANAQPAKKGGVSGNSAGVYLNTNATPANTQPAKKGGVDDNSAGVHLNTSATPANAQPAKSHGNAVGPSRGSFKKTTARKKVAPVLKKQASAGVGGVEGSIEPSVRGLDSWNGNVESGQTVGTRGININEAAKATDGSTILNFGGGNDIGFDLDVDATDAILGNLQHLPFLREDDNTRRMF
ncbi:hypothetical protein ACP70R_004761 [Stipagrostis hirtigluma subsp. patula]